MRIAHLLSYLCRCMVLPTVLAMVVLIALAPPAASAPFGNQPPRREGDVLAIFDRATVYIVTNDETTLADALLQGCHHKQRRVLTIDEWRSLPEGAEWYVSFVFLINRQRLPIGQRIPENCQPHDDEVWIQGSRIGRTWGMAYDITISAPDSAWLRKAVDEFRTLKDIPRQAIQRSVRSLAVVPVGAAAEAAALYLQNAPRPAHVVAPERFETAGPRLAVADEVLLVDRSETPSPAVAALLEGHKMNAVDTVVWREKKARGYYRAVISAPNGDLLAQAVRRYPDPLKVPERQSLIAVARDLRAVRRVAVAGVRTGDGGQDLARRLAGAAASEIRTLDSFEVLERAGLSEVLAEIALGQTGITEAKDRARVRQFAAADALLIVEVTEVNGRTDYVVRQQRLTPAIGRPPVKPREPARFATHGVAGSVAADDLLEDIAGVFGDDEYRAALAEYNRVTLPRWKREMDEYEQYYRTRPINWRQMVMARSGCAVSGSMRLVDLTDGLVLWEAPFTNSDTEETTYNNLSATSFGEDSAPPAPEMPGADGSAPDALVERVATAAVSQSIATMRGSALLPRAAASSLPAEDADAPVAGRVLDVDGDVILIGLGASDGVKLGDSLKITLADKRRVVLTVTRVRPRTCDATFAEGVVPELRSLVAIGQAALLGGGK